MDTDRDPLQNPVRPDRHGVQVTARYGWATTPEAIRQAALIQGASLYARRANIAGPMTSEQVDDVRRGWAATATAAQDLDPTASAIVAAYRKLVVAA